MFIRVFIVTKSQYESEIQQFLYEIVLHFDLST